MTNVVETWGPVEAACLQRALRLTNEAFAETLGSAPRTIAKWHANPDMSLTLEMQEALDTLLLRAPEPAQQRFELLRRAEGPRMPGTQHRREVEARLRGATHLDSALAYLDELQADCRESSFDCIVKRALEEDAKSVQLAGAANVARRDLSKFLLDYYGGGAELKGTISLESRQGRLATTLVSREAWIPIGAGLPSSDVTFQLVTGDPSAPPAPTPLLMAAAHERLAACLTGRTRFADQPTYRLIDMSERDGGLLATFGLSTFARYALTWDLLEAEVYAAVAQGRQALPLRDQLLPAIDDVVDPAGRECVGGTLALTAFARPRTRDRDADYLLLVQQRSGRVINGAGRLSVIPKCFHQPTNEARAEVGVHTTLIRELEEELFGREEVDSSQGGFSVADLLHPSRLTEPMRWLLEGDRLGLHLTGFAFNLVAGSFEFPALVAIQDEEFWARFGGSVEANWESAGLTRYSSLDSEGLENLMHDPRWSDEGLVALVLGLKRLAALAPERVRLPDFEMGVTS